MQQNGRTGLRVLLAGAVVLGSIGAARSASAAERCCFTNEGYSGVCRVVPKQDESCASILAYLNDVNSSGKTYCDATAGRGGWEQVSCGNQHSGPTSPVSSPSPVSASADTGVGAVLAKDAETYTSATGRTVEYHLKAGTIFGFLTLTGGWGEHKGSNGFNRVAFFADNNGGDQRTTWVKEENLQFFSWECTVSKSTGGLTSKKACTPVEKLSRAWRRAFKVGAGEKCKELGIRAFEGNVFVEAIAPPPAEPPTVPTTPVGPSAMPPSPVEPSAMPTTPVEPSAMPTTPEGPSAVPTTPVEPSAMPTTPVEPAPTPTASAKRSSP
jgi:hypothetical protein